MKHTKSYFTHSPNPLFARTDFRLLDGIWSFCFDPDNIGVFEKWFQNFPSDHFDIRVPYVYQAKNGLNTKTQEKDIVWYDKTVEIDSIAEQIDLVILACDYKLDLYVNGIFLASHEGGYDQIRVNIAPVVKKGKNTITFRVEDSKDKDQIRGKQFTGARPSQIFYEGVTGVYRSVYLEFLSKTNIRNARLIASYSDRSLFLRVDVLNGANSTLKIEAFDGEKLAKVKEYAVKDGAIEDTLSFDNVKPWSDACPFLYDVVLTLLDDRGRVFDTVYTYAGFVSYRIEGGRFYVNDIDTYIKAVLFQGYYEDDLYTGRKEDYLEDLAKIKASGFNALRIHQTIEDPLFLYYCDCSGIYTTLEIPSPFEMSDRLRERYFAEVDRIVSDNYHHPSVYALILFNESWGINGILHDPEMQEFVVRCYERYKKMCPHWLICSNDGWEHTKSDICSIHNYEFDSEAFISFTSEQYDTLMKTKNFYANAANYLAFAQNYQYENQPIFLSEFAGYGLSVPKGDSDQFFYGAAKNTEDFIDRIQKMYTAIQKFPFIRGICYTQYNDTYQETNGIVTMQRQFKIPPGILKALNDVLR